MKNQFQKIKRVGKDYWDFLVPPIIGYIGIKGATRTGVACVRPGHMS